MSDYKLKSMKAVGEILKAYTDESRDGPWSIGYSGGKDSTVMTASAIVTVKNWTEQL